MSTEVERRGAASEYWSQGYAAIRRMFLNAELAEIQQECARLFSLFNEEHDLHNYRLHFRDGKGGKSVLDVIDPVIDRSPLLRKLTLDPRILSMVEDIFGEPGLLFKDKVIFKAPGVNGYRAHQDYTYWQGLPAPPDAMLTVLIAVDPSRPENGELQFFPGLHDAQMRCLRTPSNIFDPNDGLLPEGALTGSSPASLELQAGDMVLFHCLTPHKSDVNESTGPRCSIYLSYAASSCGDLYDRYYADCRRYFERARAAEGDLLRFR